MFWKPNSSLPDALHVVFTTYASNNHRARAKEHVYIGRNVSDQQDILLLLSVQTMWESEIRPKKKKSQQFQMNLTNIFEVATMTRD